MSKQQYYSQQYMMQFYKMHQPYDKQQLMTPDGQRISFAQFGNPNGEPILFLHGGPGGFCQPIDLAFFDLAKHRVILWDQRHCGSSSTRGSDWTINNDTPFLLDDMEQLRIHLNIEKWHLFGGSWGTCLGLVYSITHPERVLTQVYWGILLGRQSCIDFVTPEMCSPMEQYYCQNHFFLVENYILDNVDKIKNHKIMIAHGATDNICSVENARELHDALDNSELIIADNEDHHPYMPRMFQALKGYVDKM